MTVNFFYECKIEYAKNKICYLKYGFHNKSFILNAPLVICPIPVIRSGWVGAAANPPKADDWNWATD